MTGLTETWDTAVVADEEGTSLTTVLFLLFVFLFFFLNVRQITLLDTFVVVHEYGGNIDAIGTGHTIVAFVAWNVLEVIDVFGNLHEECILFFRDGLQWSVGGDIVTKMLHVGHTAECGEHTLGSSCITESP